VVFVNASLVKTDLKGAKFNNSDLKDVIFEPDSLPKPIDIAYAKNLDKMKYLDNPDPLVVLRRSLYDAGFRKQAKFVNVSLQRHEGRLWKQKTLILGNIFKQIYIYDYGTNPLIPISSVFWHCLGYMEPKTLLFDYTCDYGTNLWKPSLEFVLIWAIFSCIYLIFIVFSNKRNGIYVVPRYSKKPPSENEKQEDGQIKWKKIVGEEIERKTLVGLRMAMWFSLTSGARLGFREFNPSHWLKLMLWREFEVKGKGWSRTLSGLQSLLSIVLVVTFILTFLGWSFEF
jgi:hypothetical protein